MAGGGGGGVKLFDISLYDVKNLQTTEPRAGLPRSGKKFWKMKNFPGQGKVRELHFQSGKFKKIKKIMEKSGNFKIFLKRLLVILVSIICKQY